MLMTILILPLGACIKIATGLVSFHNFMDRNATGVYTERQPLGEWVHISRDCINIATGNPLGIYKVCLYWKSINTVTGHKMCIY